MTNTRHVYIIFLKIGEEAQNLSLPSNHAIVSIRPSCRSMIGGFMCLQMGIILMELHCLAIYVPPEMFFITANIITTRPPKHTAYLHKAFYGNVV